MQNKFRLLDYIKDVLLFIAMAFQIIRKDLQKLTQFVQVSSVLFYWRVSGVLWDDAKIGLKN